MKPAKSILPKVDYYKATAAVVSINGKNQCYTFDLSQS